MARRLRVGKNVQGILDKCREQGAEIDVSRGHIRIHLPDGGIYYSASSPGDRRGWLNLRAELRRRGMIL